MVQTRPDSSPGAVFGAIAIGGAIATAVGTVVITIFYLAVSGSGGLVFGVQDSLALQTLFALVALFVGALAGAAVLPLRPRGPLAILLAAPAALVAFRVANLFGVLVWSVVKNNHLIEHIDLPWIVRMLTDVSSAWGLLDVVLALLAGGGVAAVRVAMVSGGVRGGSQPFPGQPPFPGQQPFPGQPPYPGPPPQQPYPGASFPPQGQPPSGPQGGPPPPGGF